ncbi:hypothetical protein PHLGIDRAFT_18523 [Phlebiopsis gigantea 11061_1 CR5-6]|uniref:Phosphatidate cytidylyltransferase n=1 Tax=Phlebiopsis gigantea (strain 11061_1 CR5-6) TaxID=745531 RepID=A0A0C3S2X9_PHLG1|nr:hypothetical protein PHLGIDRAFT_18523 [Phlebiopsis gigantea 11061_1 CR5-6]
MTLPTSDAFSLSHDPTRPPYHLSLRPTSPNIPFVSSGPRMTQTYVPPRKTVKSRRSMSNGHAPTPHKSPTKQASRTELTRHTSRKSSIASATKATAASTPPIDWEIPRKILHSSIGFFTLYLYLSHGSPGRVVIALSAGLAVVLPADILRLNWPSFARVYEKCLGFLMRESEKKTTNGVIWYLVGVIWVLALYPLDIAVVSILILSWADTAASTIGRLWGRLTPPLPRRLPILPLPLAPRKSVAGFIAGSLTGAVTAAGFWGLLGSLGNIYPIWTFEQGVASGSGTSSFGGWLGLGLISIVSGLVSGVAEALDLGSLDDNLTLPIISGGCLWGFFECLKFFS